MTYLDKYPFITDTTDLELVVLAKEANDVGDIDFRRAILIELGVRSKTNTAKIHPPQAQKPCI